MIWAMGIYAWMVEVKATLSSKVTRIFFVLPHHVLALAMNAPTAFTGPMITGMDRARRVRCHSPQRCRKRSRRRRTRASELKASSARSVPAVASCDLLFVPITVGSSGRWRLWANCLSISCRMVNRKCAWTFSRSSPETGQSSPPSSPAVAGPDSDHTPTYYVEGCAGARGDTPSADPAASPTSWGDAIGTTALPSALSGAAPADKASGIGCNVEKGQNTTPKPSGGKFKPGGFPRTT
jgi:hypothetical protein